MTKLTREEVFAKLNAVELGDYPNQERVGKELASQSGIRWPLVTEVINGYAIVLAGMLGPDVAKMITIEAARETTRLQKEFDSRDTTDTAASPSVG